MDASTFSQNRRRRFDASGVLEHRHRVRLGLGVEIFQSRTAARGRSTAHTRVRMRQRGLGYRLSQRCRTLIEELFGEDKDWHGLRRFRRRGLRRVRQETYLIGWVLNLKRLATHLGPALHPA